MAGILGHPASRSTSLSDDTRARLLEATFEQVAEVGLVRLALEDVAARAGVSRQTLYRHFGSREGLIEALVLREERWFIARVRAAASLHEAADDAIRVGVVEALHAAQEHALLRRLIETEPGAIVPLIVLGRGPVISAAQPVVEQILRERLDLPADTVSSLAEIGSRLLVSYVLEPGEESAEIVGARIARFLVRAAVADVKSQPDSERLPS